MPIIEPVDDSLQSVGKADKPKKKRFKVRKIKLNKNILGEIS